jgi:hypothetical protein
MDIPATPFSCTQLSTIDLIFVRVRRSSLARGPGASGDDDVVPVSVEELALGDGVGVDVGDGDGVGISDASSLGTGVGLAVGSGEATAPSRLVVLASGLPAGAATEIVVQETTTPSDRLKRVVRPALLPGRACHGITRSDGTRCTRC